MGACNQGGKVLEFLWWVVTRRHSLGFSETVKMENFNFRFCRYRGFRGEALTHPMNFIQWLSAPFGNRFLGSFRRNA